MNFEYVREKNDYASTIRHLIQRENDMMNHRMTWMWALQALMITAIGVVWDKHGGPVFVVCVLGVLTSVSIWYALEAAERALNLLRERYKRFLQSAELEPKTMPPLEGRREGPGTTHWYAPWRLTPVLFSLGYVCIGIIKALEMAHIWEQ